MRIIAGEARGVRLATPAGSDVRPTLDRVREAFFSIVGPALPGPCPAAVSWIYTPAPARTALKP
jgi:16S rRNA G966 N2-methylase RsmD